MTHTPGPWRVSQIGLSNNGGRAVVNDKGIICMASCHTPYKRSAGWKSKCQIRDGNAALIAAAPDLLVLVKLVYESFGGGLVITFSERDVAAFAAVIDKAEGNT